MSETSGSGGWLAQSLGLLNKTLKVLLETAHHTSTAAAAAAAADKAHLTHISMEAVTAQQRADHDLLLQLGDESAEMKKLLLEFKKYLEPPMEMVTPQESIKPEP